MEAVPRGSFWPSLGLEGPENATGTITPEMLPFREGTLNMHLACSSLSLSDPG